MKSAKFLLLVYMFCCKALAAEAEKAPVEAEVKKDKVTVQASADKPTPPADCDTKPKEATFLDPKAAEKKAAENKALQGLGLIPENAKTKEAAVIPPAAKMETCK